MGEYGPVLYVLCVMALFWIIYSVSYMASKWGKSLKGCVADIEIKEADESVTSYQKVRITLYDGHSIAFSQEADPFTSEAESHFMFSMHRVVEIRFRSSPNW